MKSSQALGLRREPAFRWKSKLCASPTLTGLPPPLPEPTRRKMASIAGPER